LAIILGFLFLQCFSQVERNVDVALKVVVGSLDMISLLFFFFASFLELLIRFFRFSISFPFGETFFSLWFLLLLLLLSRPLEQGIVVSNRREETNVGQTLAARSWQPTN